MNGPDGQFSEDSISVVEDLDPEPERGRMSGLRLDLLLGVALLLAVVLFAGWQWWRQDYLSSRYRAGQDAAEQSDWENALRYFTEAAGYADADALANGAQEQIDERDRLYNSAVESAEREDWLPALRDIREAAGIEPDYKDVDEREETALRNVTREAIGGTVASREVADPPGLYYYGPSGWVYLEGSDSHSRLRSEASQDGWLVYDMAGAGWTPPANARAPGPYDQYELEGRHLMLARVAGDRLSYRRLALDPAFYYRQIAGRHGLWGLRFEDDPGALPTWAPGVRSAAQILPHLAYQPYAATGIYTAEVKPIVTGTTVSNVVAALDPDSRRYVVAGWTNTDGTEVTVETEVQLYLAEAGVEGQRLIFTHTGGGVQSAQFSPDGRTLLVHTFSVIDRLAERQALVLVDLNGEIEPRAFINIVAEQQRYDPPDIWLSAAFVREGVFAGDLIVSEFQFDHTHVRVVDPDNLSGLPEMNGAYIDMSVPGWGIKNWLIAAQDSEGVVVAGHDDVTGYAPYNRSFSIVQIPARGQPRLYDVEKPDRSGFDMQVAPDLFSWVEYSIVEPFTPDSYSLLSVFSLPRVQPANVDISPTLAFSITYGGRTDDAYEPPSVNLGDKLFAYSSQGKVHAHNYGGTIDIALESGIKFLYPKSRYIWPRDSLR